MMKKNPVDPDRPPRLETDRWWLAAGVVLPANAGFFDGELSGFLGAARVSGALRTSELVSRPCLVLLGEPGMGKSHEVRRLATCERGAPNAGQTAVPLQLGGVRSQADLVASITGTRWFEGWRASTQTLSLYLDGLDEGVAAFPALVESLVNLLPELPPDRVRLRVCCRTSVRSPRLEEALELHYNLVKQPVALELQPLDRDATRQMAAEVLRKDADSVEVHRFISDVEAAGIEPLAARPVTLKLIAATFRSRGELPASRVAAYAAGTELLLAEWEAEATKRKLRPAIDLADATKVAECAGAAIMLGGQNVVGSVEFSLAELARGAGTTTAVVEAVLGQPLFSASSSAGVMFAHRSFAEYFAARWLQSNRSSASYGELLLGAGQVAPQVEEVAGWLAALDRDWREQLLTTHPDVLVRADPALFEEGERRSLLLALMEGCITLRIQDNATGWEDHLARLDYPGIDADLEPWIRGAVEQVGDGLFIARRTAIAIAEAVMERAVTDVRRRASALALAELLADVVARPDVLTPRSNVRARAALALRRVLRAPVRGDPTRAFERIPDDRAWLMPAVGRVRDAFVALLQHRQPGGIDRQDEQSGDPMLDDDLSGVILSCIYPGLISTEELFRLLPGRPRTGYYGSYWVFVHVTLPGYAAHRSDLLCALMDWSIGTGAGGHDDHGASELEGTLIKLALAQVTSVDVRDALVRLLWHCAKEHLTAPGPASIAAEARLDLIERLLDFDRVRRPSLPPRGELAPSHPRAVAEVGSPVIMRVSMFARWLFVGDDLEAWLERVLAHPEDVRRLGEYDAVLWHLFRLDDDGHVALARSAARAATGEAAALLRWRFAHVMTDGKLRTARKKRQAAHLRGRPKGPSDGIQPAERLEGFLTRPDLTPEGRWHQVLRTLALTPDDARWRDAHTGRVDALPLWRECVEVTRGRVRQAARSFLQEADPEDERWLGRRSFTVRLLNAVRAFQILDANSAPVSLDLNLGIWDRWALTLFDKGTTCEPRAQTLDLARRAARFSPSSLSRYGRGILLAAELDDADTMRSIADRLLDVDAGGAAAFLLDLLERGALPPALDAHLLARLLATGDAPAARARTLALARLEAPDQAEAWRQAGLLLVRQPNSEGDWSRLETWLADDANIRAMFETDSHMVPWISSARGLGATRLGRLYERAASLFPADEDDERPVGRTFAFTDRMSAQDNRLRMLGVLEDRAGPDDLLELSRLAEKYPEVRFRVAPARRKGSKNAWVPTPPGVLFGPPPQTNAVPAVRSQLVPAPSAPRPNVAAPDPAMDLATYDAILGVCQQMAMVMEHSAGAFSKMGEEDLRTHFLIPLNAQFKGAATGETFNHQGKTDILVRVNGRNIFIAECKFWTGPASLTGAIDQVVGYLAWRDTKAAVFVFNRNKDFSAVLRQIPDVVRSHPRFVREEPSPQEGSFRAVLARADDPDQRVWLTVLPFEVPR